MTLPTEPARSARVLSERLRFQNEDDVLARLPPGVPKDFRLKEAVKSDVLTVLLSTRVADLHPKDTIQLMLGNTPVGPLLHPVAGAADFAFTLTPDQRPPDVTQSFNYRVTYESSGSPTTEDGPPDQSFITDLTPPGGSGTIARPTFAPDVIEDGVTPEKLQSGPDGEFLPCVIEPFNDQAAGDYVWLYVDHEKIDGLPPVEVKAGEERDPVDFPIPKAVLEAIEATTVADEAHAFAYRLEDRAGNISDESDSEYLLLLLTQQIGDLLPPRVPAAADGLVTDGDAHANGGVEVIIPGHRKIKAGDFVLLRWGVRDIGPFTVDASQVGQDPLMTLTVPYTDVYDDWNAIASDTDLDVPVVVTYRVSRNGNPIGEPKETTEAPVNLYIPGGKDPDPTPEHEGLKKPVVRSTQGGKDNIIPADAINSDAIATIPGMRATDPALPAFAAGDEVQLYWNGAPVDEAFVVSTPGEDVLRTIPGPTLAGTGPGKWTAHYTVLRKLATEPFENTARSPAADVTIADPSELPGGGDLLPYAVFREGLVNDLGHLVLTERGADGTIVRIYAYRNMAAGDTITVTWLPNGTPTGHPSFDLEPVVLPPYEVKDTDLVPKDDYVEGDPVRPPVPELKVFVDFDISAEKIWSIVSQEGIPGYGSARVVYTVQNASGTGKSDTNPSTNPVLSIDMRNVQETQPESLVMEDNRTQPSTAPRAQPAPPYIAST
ncbi:hypothetical protein, partial [Luteibacter sp. 329MFSha]|uniref:hypothetical protein n=1 Tax=Luteibacter sp. 329MFSha TaxID=1798239 RepID=UPI0008C1FE42